MLSEKTHKEKKKFFFHLSKIGLNRSKAVQKIYQRQQLPWLLKTRESTSGNYIPLKYKPNFSEIITLKSC